MAKYIKSMHSECAWDELLLKMAQAILFPVLYVIDLLDNT